MGTCAITRALDRGQKGASYFSFHMEVTTEVGAFHAIHDSENGLAVGERNLLRAPVNLEPSVTTQK